MKLKNLIKQFSTAVPVLLLFSSPVFAQAPPKSALDLDAALVKFFGNNTNFISKADVHVTDKGDHETTSATMGFEMLAGQMRLDVNMAEVKSAELSPDLASTMKQMGMDRMITIRLPEKKTILSIYPALKSYAETPMPKEEADAATAGYKIEKKVLGKETIDGHPCKKTDVTLTDAKGEKQHAIMWYATDLQDFPVQMQIRAEDSTLVMKFKDVKIGRPELSDFDAPTGMTKYNDITALMSDAVTKKMGSSASK